MFLNMPLNFMIYVKLSSATKFGEPELRRKGWRLSTWTRVMNALCRLGHPTHRTVASMTIPLRTGLPRSVPPSKHSSMKFLRRQKQRDGGDAEEAASGRARHGSLARIRTTCGARRLCWTFRHRPRSSILGLDGVLDALHCRHILVIHAERPSAPAIAAAPSGSKWNRDERCAR